MSRMVRKLVAVGLTAAVMIGTTGAAFADLDSYVTGGHAWRANADHKTLAVADTLANSQSVYANYKQGTTTVYRFNNNSGSGTTVTLNNGKVFTSLQACQDINLLPDACDSWKS